MSLILKLSFAIYLININLVANNLSDRAIKRVSPSEMMSESKVALLVGNSKYNNYLFGELKNPENDIRAVAKKLKNLGFTIIEGYNLSIDDFDSKFDDFKAKLRANSDGVGLFYFAGHGIEVGGINYLIPTDLDVKEERKIPRKSTPLNEVIESMNETGKRLTIAIVDACRVNPFEPGRNKDSGGLAPFSASGTFIAFSAESGKVADDGSGNLSPFASALVKHIDKPQRIEELFKAVRTDVYRDTNKVQTPVIQDQTFGEFYFKLPMSVQTTNSNNDIKIDNKNKSTYSIENVERTQFALQIDRYPTDSRITIEGLGAKYNDGIMLNRGKYSILIEKSGYQPKRIKIDLQSDLRLDVSLEKIELEDTKISKVQTKTDERFTIRKNVFIDNKTGYMWEKPKIVGNWNWDSLDDRLNFTKTYGKTWADAKSYCDNLVLDGYSDWKLPSRDEFHTLMTAYYGEYNNYENWSKWFEANKHKRNNYLFVPKEISEFMVPWAWTRDISKTNTSYSWRLYFSDGDDYGYYQDDNYLFRCVR
jgi:hypothetical protein